MQELVQIKLIKDADIGKKDEIINLKSPEAKIVVEEGYAEYVEEDIKRKRKNSPLDFKKIEVKFNPESYILKNEKGKKEAVLHDKIVQEILQENIFKTIYGKRHEEVWFYNPKIGLWELSGRKIIKTLTESMLQHYCKSTDAKEVYDKIKRLTATSLEEFNKNPHNLICLSNGVLNVESGSLLSFDPEYNFRNKIDVIYSKDKDCPNINKFIEDTFYEEDIPVIQEWVGFHLYKKYFIKKAVILFGAKNTGKTVFLNLLTHFIGEKNKSGISLHLISHKDKFTLSHLKEKLANIYDDLSSNDLSDPGGFKIATGGGYISAEYKFGDSFEFKNFAKQTFATNKIPEADFKEDDEAYFLRWLPIPCDNELDVNKQDVFLIDRLTQQEELSGFLNWALEGLQRLLKNGKFSFNKSVPEIKALMEKHSNHLSAFVQDCLEEKENSRITKEKMYELYTVYAKKKNLKRLNKPQIGKRLERIARFITEGRDKKLRYWNNVSLKSDVPDDIKDTFNQPMKVIRNDSILSYNTSKEASNLSPNDRKDTLFEKDKWMEDNPLPK